MSGATRTSACNPARRGGPGCPAPIRPTSPLLCDPRQVQALPHVPRELYASGGCGAGQYLEQ